jgi:hypothetical protein
MDHNARCRANPSGSGAHSLDYCAHPVRQFLLNDPAGDSTGHSRHLLARVRNPVYLFGTIVFTGLFLFLERPLLLMFLVPKLILQMTRARAEARVLEQHFGDEYRRYRASTWF